MIQKNEKNSIISGITGALLMLSINVSFCAALGRGLAGAFLCTGICTFFSLKTENKIFTPSSLLIAPLFIFLGYKSLLPCALAMLMGAIIFGLLNKIPKKLPIPDCVLAGAFIGLALSATILLTNTYFGIGAFGQTPLSMLKSYRSLGFHPDFRGLLYGTITLFTMITYPFKFRKLSKVIPAEFLTVFIPFLLNLALNPDRKYTTTNEYSYALTSAELCIDIGELQKNIPQIILTGVAVGVLFFIIKEKKSTSPVINGLTGAFGGLYALPREINYYSKASSLVALVICAVTVLVSPHILTRLPLPSVGAMLIVSAWQQVPFGLIPSTLKKKRVLDFASMIICAVGFVVLRFATAVEICILVTLIYNTLRKELSE